MSKCILKKKRLCYLNKLNPISLMILWLLAFWITTVYNAQLQHTDLIPLISYVVYMAHKQPARDSLHQLSFTNFDHVLNDCLSRASYWFSFLTFLSIKRSVSLSTVMTGELQVWIEFKLMKQLFLSLVILCSLFQYLSNKLDL